MVAISHISPRSKTVFADRGAWLAFFQVLGASGLMALCSQIKIALPFTPVPLTLQTLAVLLIGASLGSRKGALVILLYFSQILMGLPVLSGGASDPLVFFGPKGGYVLGWCLQAFLMGWCVEKLSWSKPINLMIGGILACSVQMGLGILLLAQFVGWESVWVMGLFPFLPGEILKILVTCWSISRK